MRQHDDLRTVATNLDDLVNSLPTAEGILAVERVVKDNDLLCKPRIAFQMRQEEGDVPTHQLSLALNPQTQGKTLLIPTYRLADRPLLEQRDPAKFPITEEELALLQSYIGYLGDSRVLLARHHA
ncbi:MAG TPA: hypothetical protein PKH37_06970, partial [Alphaproteobacteria bacterium]|nr:hypothetical protein [Alphaproteobacteria bacterium]